jgi:4-hydroxythreonine-4-phosphate dehydrogenase
VRGVALGDTEIRQGSGGRQAGDMPALLDRAGLRAALLGLGEVRRGPGVLAASLRRLAADGIEAAVCDAETDRDLDGIAHAGLAAGIPTLWVGSGGLMRQLARAIGKGSGNVSPVSIKTPKPLLFVVGSASAVSHGQFERLVGNADVTPVRIAPDAAAGGPAEPAHRLQEAIATGRDVGVAIERGDAIDPRHAAALPSLLAAAVAPGLASFGGLFATGGETARAILKAAGVTSIRLGGEVEPGVPWGCAVRGGGTLYIVTKAGAFGDPDTLLRSYHALKRLTAGHSPAASASLVQSAGMVP